MAMNTASEDQRKRSMEALERRFAVAKAEALQQLCGKKRAIPSDEKVASCINTLAIASSSQLTDSSIMKSSNVFSVTKSSNVSQKKGNFTFLGSPWRDEECIPAYSQLPQFIHENLLAMNDTLSGNRGIAVDKVLHDLLQSGDSAQKYLQGSRSLKIDNWILLVNYVQHFSASTGFKKSLQVHSKRSKKYMYMKQLKKCGSFDISQDLQRYENYKPVHDMWKSYVTQLMKTSGKNYLAQCLLTADLHGAILLVAESKIKAFTGVFGIMSRETAETFAIIMEDNKLRVVPKRSSVFILQVGCCKITLLGDKLASRNLAA